MRLGEVEGEGIGVVFPGESLHVGEVQDLGAEEDPEREPAGKPGVINGCGGGGGSSSSSSSLEAHNPTGRRKTGGLGGRRDESGGSATYIETGTNTISGAVGRLRRCNGPRCVLCVLIGGLPTGCRALCSFRGTCFIYFHLLWKPTNVNDKAWVGVCATLSGAAGGGQRAAGSQRLVPSHADRGGVRLTSAWTWTGPGPRAKNERALRALWSSHGNLT